MNEHKVEVEYVWVTDSEDGTDEINGDDLPFCWECHQPVYLADDDKTWLHYPEART